VAYQETYTERPSNEIQTTLNLLFKERERGLYTQDFAKVTEFSRADLNKVMAELNRSSTRCLICKLICSPWCWICLSWFFKRL
jgi:hypothetical protein